MDYTRYIGEKQDRDKLLEEITEGLRKPEKFQNLPNFEVCVTYDTELSAQDEVTLYQIIDQHLRVTHPKFVGYKVTNSTTDDWAYIDITRPYGFSILRGRYFDSTNYVAGEDKAYFHVAPDTIVGAITANVSTDDVIIPVTDTVMENIDIGYLVRLTDGANTTQYSEVINFDKISKTITLESGINNNFSAASPTYVQMTVEMCKDIWLGKTDNIITLEGEVNEPTFIKANTTIRIGFYKSGSTEKHLFIEIEEFV